MKRYLLPVIAAVLLAACGGGSGRGQTGTVDPNAAANEASNAFFASVMNILNGTSETSEPASIDSISSGASETLEPSPL
jgi:outer membrane PBP1 activator LpoA protein